MTVRRLLFAFLLSIVVGIFASSVSEAAMGDPSSASVTAVLTTRGAAEWLDGEGVDEPQTPVWFVEMAGSFVDRFARIPTGASFPRGTSVDFTIDTKTRESLDLGVSDHPPDLSQLGTVYTVPTA